MELSFHKRERLCGKTTVDSLFAGGESRFFHPFRCVYSVADGDGDGGDVRVLVSVSKRLHKRAVVRNLLKRRVREAYRLNKHILLEGLKGREISIAFIYTSKDVLDYKVIEHGVKKALRAFCSVGSEG